MKAKILAITLLILSTISCDFGKSVDVDFLTGLKTRGDGLTCNDVYLSDGESKINRTSFIYGEEFFLNFENISGFKKIDNAAFPGMQLFVISQEGDTVMKATDLYGSYTEGVDIEPLLLNTNLTVADPLHSKQKYSLEIKIWDKNGKGTFHATMDFDVVPNEQILIETNNVSFDEIYLFSAGSNTTIIDQKAKFNENVYMIFEGLDGFAQENEMVYIGLAIHVKDAGGEVILNEEDLMADKSMSLSDFSAQLAPNVIFTDPDIKNPVNYEVLIWDKKGGGSIKATAILNLE